MAWICDFRGLGKSAQQSVTGAGMTETLRRLEAVPPDAMGSAITEGRVTKEAKEEQRGTNVPAVKPEGCLKMQQYVNPLWSLCC